jgi:cutinase
MYSQGTAVMMNAVSKLPANIKSKVVAGVLFGYTKNGQTKGSIPNYPQTQLQVYCNPNTGGGGYKDGVCGGGLNVNGGHFAYMTNGDGQKAIAFLKSKIDPALARGGAVARFI